MSNDFFYRLADAQDDAALRELLNNNPMRGAIEVVCKREPNFFHGTCVGNKFIQVMLCENRASKRIVGIATRSIKPVYINGDIVNIGYLSTLRVDREYRGRKILTNGWNFFKELHADNKADIYLTSIISDNKSARRALFNSVEKKGLGIKDLGAYYTIFINLDKKLKSPYQNNIEITRGTINDLDEIIGCLNRNGCQKQFFNYYTKEDFLNGAHTRDFSIGDFFVAKKDKKIVGVLGKWDQIKYKQMVINRYNVLIKMARPVYNLLSNFFHYAPLPRPLLPINFFNISFIAVDNNDMKIFETLLKHIYEFYKRSNYEYFAIGLHFDDPLLRVAEQYTHIKYKSHIYAMAIKNKHSLLGKLDGGIPFFEVAML